MNYFSAQDLLFLVQKKLHLRFSNNIKEPLLGGCGEAIPLYHLAGAEDILEFVSLSFLSPPHLERMRAIYERYKNTDIKSNECMPRLILYYAAQHNISDAKHRINYTINERFALSFIRAIEIEAKKMASFYKKEARVYPLNVVVKKFPSLAKELAANFNEKFHLRVMTQKNLCANNNETTYVLLTKAPFEEQSDRMDYELSRSPLGTIGCHRFSVAHVVTQELFFDGNPHASVVNHKSRVCIVDFIKSTLNKQFHSDLPDLHYQIELAFLQQGFPHHFKRACQDLCAWVLRLNTTGLLSSAESMRLLTKTKELVDNPCTYKEFIREAKSCHLIADGVLAAYIMLMAGWAAKIMTANYLGNAWIRLATEKLDYLAKIDACERTCDAWIQQRQRFI